MLLCYKSVLDCLFFSSFQFIQTPVDLTIQIYYIFVTYRKNKQKMASIDFLYLETLATIISTEVQFVPLLKFNENSTIVRLIVHSAIQSQPRQSSGHTNLLNLSSCVASWNPCPQSHPRFSQSEPEYSTQQPKILPPKQSPSPKLDSRNFQLSLGRIKP